MNSGLRVIQNNSLLVTMLHRSFSRSSIGLRLTQDTPPNQPQRNWVNTSCFAIALLGLSLSFFSTRQLTDDPNAKCLLWKK